jgi:O-antigen/teichoic acid export membrane protein
MLVRHTLLYLPAQLLAPLIQFATILAWAHLLSPEQVGIATLVVAIQDISFALFYAWWAQFTLRHLSRFRASPELRAFLGTEAVALGASTLLQLVVIPPVLLLYFGETLNPALLSTILAYLVTRSLNLSLAERARADAKILLYTMMQVGVPALGLAAGFVFVGQFGPSATAVLGAFALAQGISLILALFVSDFGRTRPRIDPIVLRQALSFGVPVMLALALALLAQNAPRFVVDQTIGLAAAGMFGVAYGLGLRTSSLASMMVTAGAYPLVVRKFETEGVAAAYAQLQRNTTLLVAVVMPAALGLIAINTSLVDILLPAEFATTAYLILPFAAFCGLLRDLRSHTTNQVFLLQGQTRYATIIGAVDLVLAASLSVLGVYAWGIEGAVFGPLIAAVLALAVSIGFATITFGFRLPLGEIARIAIAAALMATVVWLLPDTNNIVVLALEVCLGGLVYGVLLLALFPKMREEAASVFRRTTAKVFS